MKRLIALLACAMLVIGFASFAAAAGPPTIGQTIAITAPFEIAIAPTTATATPAMSYYNMTSKLRAATTLSDIWAIAIATMKTDTVAPAINADIGQTAATFIDTGQTMKIEREGGDLVSGMFSA